jgi:hypothetical protein
MSRFCFIFPVTKPYLSEARVLLRSLVKHHPNSEIPIYVVSPDLKEDSFKDIAKTCISELYLKDTFQEIHPINIWVPGEYPEFTMNREFRRIRTTRFLLAEKLKNIFDVVCILDADMCLLRPIKQIFRMAETGTILVGNNNTLLTYRKKDFDKMGVSGVPDNIDVVHPTFSTVPLFLNPKIHSDFLMGIWSNPLGNDLETNNLVAIALDKMKDVFYLNSFCVSNLHHSMLKPETHVKETKDGLFSAQGDPVYLLHGHLSTEAYIKELIEPMCKNYGWHPPFINLAKNAIHSIVKEYNKYKD